jgi:phosphohistidine phosphatase
LDLILWRHAEAEDADGTTADLERCLTRRGEKQAKRVARWLATQLPHRCRVLVSPALRTRQTADALGTAYEIEPRVAPAAAARDILQAAGWPKGKQAVLVVGHQPCLGETASLLLAGSDSGLSVRKGAIWWFGQRGAGERVEPILRAVIDPDLI